MTLLFIYIFKIYSIYFSLSEESQAINISSEVNKLLGISKISDKNTINPSENKINGHESENITKLITTILYLQKRYNQYIKEDAKFLQELFNEIQKLKNISLKKTSTSKPVINNQIKNIKNHSIIPDEVYFKKWMWKQIIDEIVKEGMKRNNYKLFNKLYDKWFDEDTIDLCTHYKKWSLLKITSTEKRYIKHKCKLWLTVQKKIKKYIKQNKHSNSHIYDDMCIENPYLSSSKLIKLLKKKINEKITQ